MKKRVLIAIAVLVFLSASLISCRAILTHNQEKNTATKFEELIKIPTNNFESSVFIRGNNPKNPVLLFVHGLGFPDMMLSRCYYQSLLSEFTVAHYDQRGVGKSPCQNCNLDSLTLQDFISDLGIITDTLQKRFTKSEIYLCAHSWGTAIGIGAIQEYPEKYACYIGISQVVNEKIADSISCSYALEKARENRNNEAIVFLESIQNTPYWLQYDTLIKQRNYLKEFGGRIHNESAVNEMKKCVLRSPEHSISELLSIPKEAKKIDRALFPLLVSLNLFETVKEINTPAFFFGGRYDYQVPSILAEQYFKSLVAPKKEFIWFEESGHLVPYEENEKFVNALIRIKESISQ